jgi:hypothetical protein
VQAAAVELDYLGKAALEGQQTHLLVIQHQLPATAADRAVLAVLELVQLSLMQAQQGMAAPQEAQVAAAGVRVVTSATGPTVHRVLLELCSDRVRHFRQPMCFK